MLRRHFTNVDNTGGTETETTFYIESCEDGNVISFSTSSTWFGRAASAIMYSYDKLNWELLSSSTQITLNADEKVYFQGNGNNLLKTSNSKYKKYALIATTKQFNVGGNLKALSNPTHSLQAYGYYYHFYNTKVRDASKLILPDLSLVLMCYGNMFYNCKYLIYPPELPATTAADKCYYQMFLGCTSMITAPTKLILIAAKECCKAMFSGCTSLAIAPKLPATELFLYCYQQMFKDCTSLTMAPVLPATQLEYGCYSAMFSGCTSLAYVHCLAIDNSASNCTSGWLTNVCSDGLFIKNALTDWVTGVAGIPENWNTESIINEKLGIEVNLQTPTNYIHFVSQQDGSYIGIGNLALHHSLYISRDLNIWYICEQGTLMTINKGDCVYVAGILSNNNDSSTYTRFAIGGYVLAIGDCNALWNYENLNEPLKNYCGYKMFSNCTGLITVPELHATTLTPYCYAYMFYGCTKLVNAPVLPSVLLADGCYCGMFGHCKTLVEAPELPATDLTTSCYRDMFAGCSSLHTPPELPAMQLTYECYRAMFSLCRALTVAPLLPATSLAEGCYFSMFSSCTSLVNAPELPATTLVKYCYQHMFHTCTSLVNAPELPALILVDHCYATMFVNCTSLVVAPDLNAPILVLGCYTNMFYNCSNLSYIQCLATDTSASTCISQWVDNVNTKGTFIKHPEANWTSSQLPYGNWTVQNYVE